MSEQVTVNRAPVLTLWGAAVAQRLGFDRPAALSFGKCLAGLNAQAKGRMLGIYHAPATTDGGPPKKVGLGEEFWVEICGRPLPAKNAADGIRAVVGDKPIDPTAVQKYLEQKFGDDLPAVWEAMAELAAAYSPDALKGVAYSLYERFRPSIPKGQAGWGAKGILDLALMRSLAPQGQ